MKKTKKKKSVVTGLIIILCILIILPVVSFITRINKRDIVLSSQELSFNGDVSQILPDTVSFSSLTKDYEFAVVWDTKDFDNQKVGEQRVYATFVDDSAYFKSNVKDIYIDINVLPHSINSTASSGLSYVLINNKTEYGVARYTGSDSVVVIPAEYKGKPVTAIRSGALTSSLITNLEFPATINAIGGGSFAKENSLAKINFLGRIDQWCEIKFGDSNSSPIRLYNDFYINGELVTDVKLTNATKISSYAFYSCKSLKSIEISDTVTSIGEYAFRFCESLKSIVVPYGVGSIGQYAFDGCKKLETVELPNSITSLESHLFQDCIALKSIEIPNSVTNIADLVFYNTTSLTELFIPKTVLAMGVEKDNGVVRGCSLDIVIYCEAESQPSLWSSSWNYNKRTVVWGASRFVE